MTPTTETMVMVRLLINYIIVQMVLQRLMQEYAEMYKTNRKHDYYRLTCYNKSRLIRRFITKYLYQKMTKEVFKFCYVNEPQL